MTIYDRVSNPIKIAALAGGVGGAKLADGLAQVMESEHLAVIVNTGDDFEHLGLKICPDIDTVCYTLAGIANPVTGWGRASESWHVMDELDVLGGPTWFRLGDRDFATHLERTRLLQSGMRLTEITSNFCKAWGIGPRVLPMADQPVPTIVLTEEGELAFQEYFVFRKCEPVVHGFRFEGAPSISDEAQAVLSDADMVIITPSNPWVSVDPILSVPGYRPLIERKPVVAVSPIVGGQAIKGPAAKMYRELGITPSALSVAHHYKDIISGFVMDAVDAELADRVAALGVQPLVTETVMKNRSDRARLAREILHFGQKLLLELQGVNQQ